MRLSVRVRLILRNSVAEMRVTLAGLLVIGVLAIGLLVIGLSVIGLLVMVGTGCLVSLNVGIDESNARVQIAIRIMRVMMSLIRRMVMRVPFFIVVTVCCW